MKTTIHWIFKPILKRREAKIKARRRAKIDYCLQREDFKYEDLIPILDEEYDRLVADLEEKIAKKKADEPFHDFCWSEIVASMKTRRRDAYRLNYPCRECGRTNLIYFCFRTNDESWNQLRGREGYMLICPDCLSRLRFVYYVLN